MPTPNRLDRDLDTVARRTRDEAVRRMTEIRDEIERLTHFDQLSRAQEEQRERLRTEFDALEMTVRSGDVGIRLESGSPDHSDRQEAAPTGVLRDDARRALDGLRGVPDDGRERLAVAFERCEAAPDGGQELDVLSRWLIATSTPAYARACARVFRDPESGHREFDAEELAAWREAKQVQRAMSLTDAAGGFLVPTHLDPSVIITNTGAVDPMRRIARVETIASDVFNGVSSAGVTASWDAEAAEVSDDSPTLAAPAVPTFMARAFVAASIEVAMDGNIGQAVAPLLVDAKTQLEAASYAKGSGSGQPTGVVTGLPAGSKVATATADTLVAADVTKPFTALPPRYQGNASALGNLATLTAIAAFETAGGALRYPEVGNNRLLRKPLFEHSSLDTAGATAAAGNDYVLVVGDFRQYLIVDRVGLTVEFIPHLFGANRRPTGQRAWFAYWRSGGARLVDDAFRALTA